MTQADGGPTRRLSELLEGYVADGTLPGAVGVVARGDRIEAASVGALDVPGTGPMTRDSIFRIASVTKPIVAAAVLILVDDGRVALTDPIARWLPELAAPMVVRTPTSALDDVVPARRPVTVEDVLTSRTGWGFPSDFSSRAVQALSAVQKDGRNPQTFPPPEEWLNDLARVPMSYQPGEAWSYDTSYTIAGLLVARAAGQPLRDFLAERLFEPLGMADTAFVVPPEKRHRFTSYYLPDPNGGLALADAPDGQWSSLPALELGNGGLAGTADDWLRFGTMLLDRGTVGGRQLISPELVRGMLTDQLTERQRRIGELLLQGQGWGYGGAVDITATDQGTVPGRYGWVGGTGTTAHVIPATRTVAVLLTQVGVASPEPQPWIDAFWRYVAQPVDGGA